jgi:hypothetical protein
MEIVQHRFPRVVGFPLFFAKFGNTVDIFFPGYSVFFLTSTIENRRHVLFVGIIQ